MKKIFRKIEYILVRAFIRSLRWLGTPTIVNIDMIFIAVLITYIDIYRNTDYIFIIWTIYLLFVSPTIVRIAKGLKGM